MKSYRLATLPLFAVLLLTACEDPSNVGLGLIGESGGEPEVVSLPVESYTPEEIRDVTGGAVILTSSNTTPRFLAGHVEDPLIGTIRATGHVDFSTVSGISDEFREGTVTAAELRLSRDYVYGDTTSTLDVEVRDISGAWDARAPVDTTIATGSVVTVQAVPVAERTVVIPLPQSWIDANDAVLRSETFTTDFQGLALSATAGNAVLGFAAASARLRVVSAGDTVDYVPSRALTTTDITHADVSAPIIQDGTGEGLALTLPESLTDLGPAGVNGVSLRLPADSLLTASEKPAGFVRPVLNALRLTARMENEEGEMIDLFVADAVLSGGRYTWPVGALPESFFQDLIAGRNGELLIGASPALYTLDPVLLMPSGAADAPSLVLTLTRAGI